MAKPKIGRPLNLRAHLGAYILQTVHGWTDRWTEKMVRFYFPARLFCGYLDSTGSVDRTRIEDFRNRFGERGAELITHDPKERPGPWWGNGSSANFEIVGRESKLELLT